MSKSEEEILQAQEPSEAMTGSSPTETASGGAIVVISRNIALRMLLDTWRDPDWWREHGAAMDSHDCADELEKVLAATTLSTEVSSAPAASPAPEENTPQIASGEAIERRQEEHFDWCLIFSWAHICNCGAESPDWESAHPTLRPKPLSSPGPSET